MSNFGFRKQPDPDRARRRALAQWRGVDLSPLEVAQKMSAKPANTLVANALKALNLDQKRGDAEVFKAWNQLMDSNIAAHAQPTGLVRGTLFVSVDSDVWKDEIVRYRRREILQRLQYAFGRDVVQRISFRVGG